MILNPDKIERINPKKYGAARSVIQSLIETVRDLWSQIEDREYERREVEDRKRVREPVLVVGHGDGWIEVYADKHVDVRIINAPWTGTPEGEILAEQWVFENIPWMYRELLMSLRKSGLVERVLPSEIADRQMVGEIYKALG